jgi:biliverdin reductase
LTLAVAVVGLGRAGRARVRALAAHPRARLAAVARRAPGEGERSFWEVVRDPAIDAAIVCTSNLAHEPQARALLDSGKHVAVEFPLAASAEAARRLLALARARGRVLHAEHIEVLSSAQRALRERAAALGRPLRGGVRFTGSAEGWIGDPAQAGSPALRALPRLSRLVDLFGPAEVASAACDEREGGHALRVDLDFRAGGRATLVEERGPGLARATRFAIECERGTLGDPAEATAGDPFREDLDCFLDRILRGAPPYLPDARMLHVLALVGAVERATGWDAA